LSLARPYKYSSLIPKVQFYGFSDAITMKLLEEMKGYEEASRPEPVEEEEEDTSNETKTS
jgi:hypothetical protein